MFSSQPILRDAGTNPDHIGGSPTTAPSFDAGARAQTSAHPRPPPITTFAVQANLGRLPAFFPTACYELFCVSRNTFVSDSTSIWRQGVSEPLPQCDDCGISTKPQNTPALPPPTIRVATIIPFSMAFSRSYCDEPDSLNASRNKVHSRNWCGRI